MTLTSAEGIAAYVGAAAWLPQIGSFLYRKYSVAKVRIIPERSIEMGYTSFGPILNVRLAFSTADRDTVLDRVSVELRHEDGDSKSLLWQSFVETFSEITDASGNRQRVERDQPAIALKLSTSVLSEKIVRFQDATFQDQQRARLNSVQIQLDFLKKANEDYREKLLQTREMYDLIELYQHHFWWRPGKYSLNYAIQSPDRSRLRKAKYHFVLPQSFVDDLRANINLMAPNFRNMVMSGAPDFVPAPLNWTWRYLTVIPDNKPKRFLGIPTSRAV